MFKTRKTAGGWNPQLSWLLFQKHQDIGLSLGAVPSTLIWLKGLVRSSEWVECSKLVVFWFVLGFVEKLKIKKKSPSKRGSSRFCLPLLKLYFGCYVGHTKVKKKKKKSLWKCAGHASNACLTVWACILLDRLPSVYSGKGNGASLYHSVMWMLAQLLSDLKCVGIWNTM